MEQRPARIAQPAAKAAGISTAHGTTAAGKTSSGDMYAAHDGNVYKNTGSGWQSYNNGSWNNVQKPATSSAQSYASAAPGWRTVGISPDGGSIFGAMRSRKRKTGREVRSRLSTSRRTSTPGAAAGVEATALVEAAGAATAIAGVVAEIVGAEVVAALAAASVVAVASGVSLLTARNTKTGS